MDIEDLIEEYEIPTYHMHDENEKNSQFLFIHFILM